MNRLIFLMIALALTTSWALAQQDAPTGQQSDTETPAVQESLKVWGTEITTSTNRLDDEVFALKQPDHISDLLRTLPGVDVGGAHSLNQRITIRSMDDKDLQITIDGASQNSYMYHHMGNVQIHADILKSVELDVGKNSIIHGGLGGGAHFKTKEAGDLLAAGQKLGARLLANYGDNSGSGISASGYGRMGEAFDFLVYYNQLERDNYKVGGSQILDGSGNLVPDTDGYVRGHEGDVGDGLVKLGWNLAEHHRLEIGFEAYGDEGDYSFRPDMGLATDLAIADNLGLPLVYPTDFTRDTLRLGYSGFVANNTTLEATLYVNDSQLWRDQSGVAEVFGGESIIEGQAKNSGARLFASTILGSSVEHHLNYGFDIRDYDTEYTTDGNLASSESSTGTALFIEDRIRFNDKLTIVPGLRYDRVDLDSNLVDDSFDQISSALALEYQVSSSFLVRASGTQLFKSPEIGEVFVGAGLNDTANAGIEAEKGINTEVGFEYQDAVLGADRFRAGATLFQTQVDNFIYDYLRTADFNGKDNIGDMTIDGVELFLGFEINDFQALINYDIADSSLDAYEGYAQFDDARLDRQQGDTYSLNLDYALDAHGLRFHWDTLHVASVNADLDLNGATLDNSKDDYTVSNLSLRWQPDFLQGIDLMLAADNVFDQFYASHSSRTGVSFHPRFGQLYLFDYEPGRNVKLSLSYRY